MSTSSSSIRRRALQGLFVLVVLALCAVTLAIPSRKASSAAPSTTPTTCDPAVCTTANPSGVTAAASTTDPVWGDPVKVEEFGGTSLDSSATGWMTYNAPNGTPHRSPQNLAVGEGTLTLVGTYNSGTKAQMGAGLAQRYDQMFGRWEVRARSDKGAGFSPTILLWPKGDNWPAGGEIDLLESPKGDRSHSIAVVHNGPSNRLKSHPLAIDASEWHTYAVEWLPNRITFLVDGKEMWTVTERALLPDTAPMHIAVQNDAGCGWIQCPNKTTQAETNMQVDWIKVYALPGGLH